jgi:hypothetical protein
VSDDARASEVVLRDFDAGSPRRVAAGAGAEPASADDLPPPAEHPALLVLGTDGDEPSDWLVAGQATARLLLRAALDGVSGQPLTAVLEEPYQRTRLRAGLQLLGHPQMVVRLGYGTAGPGTARRPVDDVLEVVTG